jgi:hypothetical protein
MSTMDPDRSAPDDEPEEGGGLTDELAPEIAPELAPELAPDLDTPTE